MVTIRMNSHGKSGIFGGILFLVVGLALATWGFTQVRSAKASKSWPTVDARVTHSEVDRHREFHTGNTSRRRETKYTADIRYTYEYEGISHTGKRVSFGGSRKGSSGMAHQIVRRYPVGKTVSVYVNPAKPTVACLEPGVRGITYVPLGIGVIFALVGLGTAVAGVIRS